jgi:Flp pilus assembly protein TadB
VGRVIEEFRLPLMITLGALAGVGAVVLYVALTGSGTSPEAAGERVKRFDLQRSTFKLTLGLGAGVAVLVLTHWPSMAVGVGLVVVLWDQLFGGSSAERRAISRVEGLAAWTESLRDTIAGAVGLEQAIPATAVNAAPSIRPSLNLLVDRLRVREPLPDALLKFADDLDDPSADLIVASLMLNARLRGPGLRDVLTALAEAARDELDLRRRVEGTRRSTRRSVQIVVGVIVLMVGFLVLFNQDYMSAYTSVTGQVVMAVVLAMFASSILWLRNLSGIEAPERFLVESARHVEDDVDVPAPAGRRR